jgi:hypothetical protein
MEPATLPGLERAKRPLQPGPGLSLENDPCNPNGPDPGKRPLQPKRFHHSKKTKKTFLLLKLKSV